MQFDFENRNRSSNEVGVDYILMNETLDSINSLYLSNLNLNDWIRLNDRQNTLQVIDLKTILGDITYSNLNSNIDKDVTNYGHNYDLSTVINI